MTAVVAPFINQSMVGSTTGAIECVLHDDGEHADERPTTGLVQTQSNQIQSNRIDHRHAQP
jgi:hypothetical protein